jgi:hypothetical protein
MSVPGPGDRLLAERKATRGRRTAIIASCVGAALITAVGIGIVVHNANQNAQMKEMRSTGGATDPVVWAIFETWSESQQAARATPIRSSRPSWVG